MALGITGAASLCRRGQSAAALAFILLSAGAAGHAAHARIADGKDLLRAMHARYQHDWYETTLSRPFVHMLLVLGFDVYRQSPRRTIEELAGQGFDLTKLHEATWEGATVYVVGADAGDLRTKQFWIDRKRLLFVRLIEPDERDAARTDDTRFEDYRRLSPGWVAARVELYIAGKNVFSEHYSDIHVNPKLDPAIFDPRLFGRRHWER